MFSTPAVVHPHSLQTREVAAHYRREYRAVVSKLGRRAPGRNIVKWGLPNGRRATIGDVLHSIGVLSRMLHPAAARVVVQSAPASATPVPAQSAPQPAQQSASATGLEGCVIQHESGGNPQATNGQYAGLGQWSPAAWAQDGGTRYAPSPLGASAAEQERVLAGEGAAGMQQQQGQYDGC